MRSVLKVIVVATVGWSCLGVMADGGNGQSANVKQVVFTVVGSTDNRALEDVRVLLVSRKKGLEDVGKTNALGKTDVLLPEVSDPDNMAVLFCKPEYTCGAFVFGQHDYDLIRREMINLAPSAIE